MPCSHFAKLSLIDKKEIERIVEHEASTKCQHCKGSTFSLWIVGEVDSENTNLHWSFEHRSCNRNFGNCVLFHTSHLVGRQCRGNGSESPWNVLLSYFKTLSFGPARVWTCCLARTADRRPTNWAWRAAIKATLHKNSNPGPMAWGAPALSPGHDNLCWGLTGSVPLGLEIALSEKKVLFSLESLVSWYA